MTNKVYVLRNCHPDMTSHGGFVWPKNGYVRCTDWLDRKMCGNGLHGFLWGVGDTSLLHTQNNCYWLIVQVDMDKIVDLGGKVKFPEGNVVYCVKDRNLAVQKLISLGANPDTIMFGTSSSGVRGTSSSGDFGTSSSGDFGTSRSGHYGSSSSSYGGTSISGVEGTSISGDFGTSISGVEGTSISGDFGTSISDSGVVQSGNNGTLIVYWMENGKRHSILGKIPEEYEPDTKYTLDKKTKTLVKYRRNYEY